MMMMMISRLSVKSSIENEKIEELKRKPILDNSTGNLKDHQQIKKNSWRGYITQA